MGKYRKAALAQEAALNRMAVKATEMGLHGVAWVLICPPQSYFLPMNALVVDRLWDNAEETKEWSPSGGNYFGICGGKLAQVLRTEHNSSVSTMDPLPMGEVPYGGWRMFRHELSNTLLGAGFSGNKGEEEDVTVAIEGIGAMVEILSQTQNKQGKKTRKGKKGKKP